VIGAIILDITRCEPRMFAANTLRKCGRCADALRICTCSQDLLRCMWKVKTQRRT